MPRISSISFCYVLWSLAIVGFLDFVACLVGNWGVSLGVGLDGIGHTKEHANSG